MTILTKEKWEASIAETWSASIKATYQHLIDEAVKAEREACANTASLALLGADKALSDRVLKAIRARGQA
jgi:hypothetical protein